MSELITAVETVLEQHKGIVAALTLLAGSGGIGYWIDKFRGRIRVIYRFSMIDQHKEAGTYYFEVDLENIGHIPTAIEPDVFLSYYDTETRKKSIDQLFVAAKDRRLLPLIPNRVDVWPPNLSSENYRLQRFITMRLALSRGRPVTLRFRDGSLQQSGFFRFHFERLLFVWFGWHSVQK